MAKFEKGNPGRPKGAKNKSTLLKASVVMATMKFNPTEFLVNLALAADTPPDIKMKIGQDLLSYTDRKLKATDSEPEGSVDDGQELVVVSDAEVYDLLKKSE